MSEIMLQLGLFQFSVNTAAYQSLTRSTSYRWARQSRINAHDDVQFTGYGEDTIELEGVVYPHFRAGWGQIEKLRLQAGLATPLPLVAGTGKVFGIYVIEGITERETLHHADGKPQKQEFTIRLGRYNGTLASLLRLITG